MRFFKLLFILLVMLVGAAFAVMNAENVNLNYYFGSTVLPLSVVLVGAVCFGALLGILAGLGGLASLKYENANLRRGRAWHQGSSKSQNHAHEGRLVVFTGHSVAAAARCSCIRLVCGEA